MRIKGVLLTAVAAGLLTVAFAGAANAQVFVTQPAVSYYYAQPAYYTAPQVVSYSAPQVVSYSAPQVVSYYSPAGPVVAAPAVVPAVNYYAPAPVAFYPATVSRGLFGRTTVRTPFYKIRY